MFRPFVTLTLFLILHSPALLAQKIQPTAGPLTYTGRQLVVGSGGGFTGHASAYYLFENGHFFTSTSDSTFTRLRNVPAATVRRLFESAERDCRIRTTTFDHPGNRYRFVRWQRRGQSNTVTWGDARQPAPAPYLRFYRTFMALIPGASSNP